MSPYSLGTLSFHCLSGEAQELVPAPGLWVTLTAKTSQGLWSYTWHQLARKENAKLAQDVRRAFKQQSREELAWDQLLAWVSLESTLTWDKAPT